MMKYILSIPFRSLLEKSSLSLKSNSPRPEIGKRKFILHRVYNQSPELSIGEVGLKIWAIYMNNNNICSYVSAK